MHQKLWKTSKTNSILRAAGMDTLRITKGVTQRVEIRCSVIRGGMKVTEQNRPRPTGKIGEEWNQKTYCSTSKTKARILYIDIIWGLIKHKKQVSLKYNKKKRRSLVHVPHNTISIAFISRPFNCCYTHLSLNKYMRPER